MSSFKLAENYNFMKAKYILFSSLLFVMGCAENSDKSTNANAEIKSAWEKKSYNELYCEFADSLKRTGEEIYMDWDTTCKKVKIDVVQWNEQNELGNKINDFVFRYVVGDGGKFKSIDEWLKYNHNSSFTEEFAIDASVKSENEKFVGMEISNEWYGGGAHGGFDLTLANFDRKDGHLITIEEVVLDGKLDEFTKLSSDLFFKSFPKEDVEMLDVNRNTFYLAKNFSMGKDGIRFVYQQYEIGAYAIGMPEIVVPLANCQNLIRAEFLNEMAK